MNSPARIALVCVVLALAAGYVFAEKQTKTLTGQIKAAEMYNGKVVAVLIADPSEGDFLIARSTDIGKELLHQVGSRVKLTGYVKKPRPGSEYTLVIDVLEYETDPPNA